MPRSKDITTELPKEWRLIPGHPLPHPMTPQARNHHIRLRRRDRDRLWRNLRYCWGVCRNGLRPLTPPSPQAERGRPAPSLTLQRPRGVVEQFLDRIAPRNDLHFQRVARHQLERGLERIEAERQRIDGARLRQGGRVFAVRQKCG